LSRGREQQEILAGGHMQPGMRDGVRHARRALCKSRIA
jgi:hypothetical protein